MTWRRLANLPLWIPFAIAILALQSVTLYRQSNPRRIGAVETPERLNLTVGSHSANGRDQASLVMVEFSEFECPFCKKYAEESEPRIRKEYVDTGKLRTYFRHFPLPIHTNARTLAEIAACAAVQGKFWEVHDILFEYGMKYADHLNDVPINPSSLYDCVKTRGSEQVVDSDLDQGESLGVQGTPTFFIGIDEGKGEIRVLRIVRGAQPFGVFKGIFDSLERENRTLARRR